MNMSPSSETATPKLLVQLIEEKSRWIGTHTFMRYPTDNWQVEGYRTLTWKQYADAINKVAYWLDEQLGLAHDNDTVAYFGPADARYAIILPAVIKTNRKLFVPDGRVTPEGLEKIIKKTKCVTWIHPEEDSSFIQEANITIKTCAFPNLSWCLDSVNHKSYFYTKTFDQGKHDEVVIIHTSGTTGNPKPIYHTNGFYASFGATHSLSKLHWPRGIYPDAWMGKSILSSAPPQWLGGLDIYIFAPVFNDTSSVLPPADAVSLPPEIFKQVLKHNVVDGMQCPPHTIHELHRDPSTRPLLYSFKFLFYLGAALHRDIGDALCQHTKLVSLIGSTETGPQLDLNPIDKKLWYTHSYVPENGHKMIRIEGSGTVGDGSDDLFELFLFRAEDGRPNIYQCAFWNPAFKDVDKVETKELYRPIKDLDGSTRWVFSARKDDLTKLNWLAKFHAQDIESRIKKHDDVSEVFVGGEGRPAPYVIVEARGDVLDLEGKKGEHLLEELYNSIIKKGNDGDVKEISIPRETVMLASPEKKFKRSNKGTLMREEIEKDYNKEIDRAYVRLATVNGA